MEFLGTTLVSVGCVSERRAGRRGRGASASLARTIHHATGVQLGEVDVLTRARPRRRRRCRRRRRRAAPLRIYHAHHLT